jgi:ABC-type sulfate/molybdate transport systems ATPase subunit
VVQRALDELLVAYKGVAVVIAHRLTTIKNCDAIVVCEQGKNVEEGSHDELLQIPVRQGSSETGVSAQGEIQLEPTGYYHHLWDTQMGEGSVQSPQHMSGEQLEAREKQLESQHARMTEQIRQERERRNTRWSVVSTRRDKLLQIIRNAKEQRQQSEGDSCDTIGAHTSMPRFASDAKFAMMLLDEWRPSADWEDGLKVLERVAAAIVVPEGLSS